jgi:hypothetical protein
MDIEQLAGVKPMKSMAKVDVRLEHNAQGNYCKQLLTGLSCKLMM